MHNAVHEKLVLKVESVVKDFGAGKGVFDVSLRLDQGKVVGFVGPNGAGKSTTINILTGLTKPDAGTLEVFGKTYSYKDFYKLATRIGVMYSELTLDQGMTAREVFIQSQEIFGKDCSREWQAMAMTLDLDLHKAIKHLSLGNKKKVGIIHSLMHRPELIIMDEPTSGLDPIIRERFVLLIKEAAGHGASVLLSSHDLGEIQEVSDRVVMIKEGKIVLDEKTDRILNLAQRTFQLIRPPHALVLKIKSLKDISHIIQSPTLLSFQARDYEQATRLITDEGFYNFYIEKPSLEGSFKDYYE